MIFICLSRLYMSSLCLYWKNTHTLVFLLVSWFLQMLGVYSLFYVSYLSPPKPRHPCLQTFALHRNITFLTPWRQEESWQAVLPAATAVLPLLLLIVPRHRYFRGTPRNGTTAHSTAIVSWAVLPLDSAVLPLRRFSVRLS